MNPRVLSVGVASNASSGYAMTSSGSTGQCRRTRGMNPRVLSVGVASDASG
jgi:hypothetical protein